MTTSYEIELRHDDGRRWLIGYSVRRTLGAIDRAVYPQREKLRAVTGLAADSVWRLDGVARYRHYLCGPWHIGFSGRTRLDAQREGARNALP